MIIKLLGTSDKEKILKQLEKKVIMHRRTAKKSSRFCSGNNTGIMAVEQIFSAERKKESY